ncbi:zona pellucida sperm-binding protein 1-like [Alosa pseudoharengus]|uniref:zona pellucida sperm-binding protein 1-like n=1 Tax=Alosa pseudoharengus TaxID=34774 RepID=UPI003F89671B
MNLENDHFINAGSCLGLVLQPYISAFPPPCPDHTYTSYHPQYHRPLGLLLGKPLYLEVRLLNPPDPDVVLLVHYCVAYPRSAHAAWVLIYDGCPNPLDSAPQVTPTPPLPDAPSQTRRFTVSTFQFLANENREDAPDPSHSDEEIYFMCSTEVCSPSDGPCVEGCFSDPSEDNTKR